MNVAEKHHVGRVARLRCVICVRFDSTGLPSHVHHVAEGSGHRSWFAVAPLCSNAMGTEGHHRGVIGFHAAPKAFLRRYKLSSEYDLLVMTNEDLAKRDLADRREP